MENICLEKDSLTCDTMKEKIVSHNYFPIAFSLPHKEFRKTADHFFSFLTLPLEVKQRFYLLTKEDDRESMVGYMKREQQKGDLDEKEYFHYNRYAKDAFGALPGSEDKRVTDFFSAAHSIYEDAEDLMRAIIQEFDVSFPGLYQNFFPEDAHPHFYLRFLKYSSQGRGDLLAGGHYDLGGCTLALAESAPGLRIGRDQETLQEIEHRDGQAIFMPGLQFHELTSDDLPPAWHDVVQKKDDRMGGGEYGDDTARWAVVFFADPATLTETRWEDRHRPKSY